MKDFLYTIFSAIMFPVLLLFFALGFIYEHLRMMFGAGKKFAEKKLNKMVQDQRGRKEKE